MATAENLAKFQEAIIANEISAHLYEEKPNGLPPRLKYNAEEDVWEDPIAQSHYVIFKAALESQLD